MKTIFQLQAEFLRAGDVVYPVDTPEGISLAETLVREEFKEWHEEPAYTQVKTFNQLSGLNDLKEMCDLIYVCSQYLNQSVGPEKAQALYEAVHNNNMGKCIDGKLVKREDGKILKPAGFKKDGWIEDFIEILK